MGTWSSCLIVAFSVAVLSGCDPPGKPNPADRPASPENVLEFGTLFKRNCAGCHGADGELGPAPPLHDGLFRASIPETELKRVLIAGRPGTPMPAFARANGGALSPTQIQVLVYEIKGIPYKIADERAGNVKNVEPTPDAGGIAPKWGSLEPIAATVPSYLRSASRSTHTSGDYERIRKTVFARACAGCHGEHGQGGTAAGAINDPSFLALISDQALRRLIITGRPDLKDFRGKEHLIGMPDYAGTDGRAPDFKPLTSDEIDDLVALLASWRKEGGVQGAPDVQTSKR